MKRRAILEMVCRLRKDRDFWRKMMQDGVNACNDEHNSNKGVHFHAGMMYVVQERKGMADAFHIFAHKCMELLGR